MAANHLKKESVVILRLEGEDLLKFLNSPDFETVTIPPLWEIDGCFLHCVMNALMNLTVDHGMPPVSDTWVKRNILIPSLDLGYVHIHDEDLITRETILEELKKAVRRIAQYLKENPVILARNECIYDGSEIKKLLSNKLELNKIIDDMMQNLEMDDTLDSFARTFISVSMGFSQFGKEKTDNLIVDMMKNLDDVDD
ncbi:uncharacterized protein LOC124917682, partial [Impatiens glandulifera]|uniref:uncharacterized protein LOC124917682 n=1 Tax=Impatiens glandulifera TaxID=253017 RepID=UPI001FB0FFF1